MSDYPQLPQEICDLIIDLLHDKPDTLRQCCLVSSSWVSRTRKHLFARVEIVQEWDLLKWTKAFPDPANSPAHHARTLVVDAAFGEGGERSWIHAFSCVERLIVECGYLGFDIGYSLIPFSILAPSLKSLRVNSVIGTPHSQVFGLISSLPFLEDLALHGDDTRLIEQVSDGPLAVNPPSTPPALTGTLDLSLESMERSLRLLLDLPGGLHFRKLTLGSWRSEEKFPLVAQLMAACSETLECLDIACKVDGKCPPGPINLSTLTKLKDVTIRCESLNIGWVIATLKTIGSKNLQQVSIHLPRNQLKFEEIGVATPGRRWSDFDRLLVQFYESRSIRSKVLCPRGKYGGRETKDWAGFMMPESSGRGIVDLVEVS